MRLSLLPLVGLVFLSACANGDTTYTPTSEQGIKQELAKANYCESVSDCVDVGAKCPFGCYLYVNKDEAPRLKPMIEGFQSTCQYSCIAIKGVECVQNKCQVIPDAPAQDPEGNVGAACTDDTECITPMSYLARSSCPFTSKCLEGSCAVVCPTDDRLTPERGGSE